MSDTELADVIARVTESAARGEIAVALLSGLVAAVLRVAAAAPEAAARRGAGEPFDTPRSATIPLLPMKSVKVKATRVRGHTRISAKNQATIPVEALKRAGLKSGDELRVEAAGPGRILLVRASDVVLRHAGRLTGVYPSGYLAGLRSEWR